MIPGIGAALGAGGGGLSASSSASATSGDARGTSGTGVKNISFGNAGNPNTAAGVFQNPLVIIGLVGAIYLVTRSKKR